MPSAEKQEWHSVKVSNESILKATNRHSASSTVGVHVGIAASKEQAARKGAANRTAPIESEGTDIAERTRAEVAVACHGQFKRRGKSSCSIITAPT